MVILIGLLAGAVVALPAHWLLVERHRAAVPPPAGTHVVEEPAPYRPRRRSLEEKLDTAAVTMSSTTFYALQAVVGVVLLMLALLLGVPAVFAVVVGAVGLYLPHWWLTWEIERQARALAEELPGAAEDVAGALRVHRAVRPALTDVCEALKAVSPESLLARELERVLVDAEAAGGSIESGLQSLQKRARNADLQQLAGTLLVFHRAGPNMLEILAAKAQDSRANLQLRAEIQSNLSEHKFLLRITPLLALGAYFFLSTDPMVREFQGGPAGIVLVLLVAAMMAIGYVMVQAMIRDAEP